MATTKVILPRAWLLLLLLFTIGNECARILGVIPTPSISHQIPFRPIWRELAARGHQVVLLTTDPINDPSLTNLKEIDLHFSYDLDSVVTTLTNEENEYPQHPLLMLHALINSFNHICNEQLGHVEVQELLRNESERFDLVMIEVLNPVMFGFQYKYGCPFIGLVSMDAHLAGYDAIGSPTHPALNPDFMLPFAGKLSFFERVFSVVYSTLMRWYGHLYIVPVSERVMKDRFGSDASIKAIMPNMDMLFINANPLFHGIRPVVPAAVYIGGGLHLTPPKALPQDLQSYMDDASEGVIYFSLGSNVKSKDLAEGTLRIMTDAFSELPYSILWKFEADDLVDRPKNVRIMKWLPQQDLLRHPNVKLFITQGGLQSIEEAIFSNVPMIGMPFFGDQIGNVKKMELKGLGVLLDHKTLTKNNFKKAIMEVINNPAYKQSITKLAELARDEPMTGLERAIWWTEYVIRHKGAKHLRSPAIDMPTYQYLLLDVIGFLLFVFAVISYALVKILQVVLRLMRKLFGKNSKTKTN